MSQIDSDGSISSNKDISIKIKTDNNDDDLSNSDYDSNGSDDYIRKNKKNIKNDSDDSSDNDSDNKNIKIDILDDCVKKFKSDSDDDEDDKKKKNKNKKKNVKKSKSDSDDDDEDDKKKKNKKKNVKKFKSDDDSDDDKKKNKKSKTSKKSKINELRLDSDYEKPSTSKPKRKTKNVESDNESSDADSVSKEDYNITDDEKDFEEILEKSIVKNINSKVKKDKDVKSVKKSSKKVKDIKFDNTNLLLEINNIFKNEARTFIDYLYKDDKFSQMKETLKAKVSHLIGGIPNSKDYTTILNEINSFLTCAKTIKELSNISGYCAFDMLSVFIENIYITCKKSDKINIVDKKPNVNYLIENKVKINTKKNIKIKDNDYNLNKNFNYSTINYKTFNLSEERAYVPINYIYNISMAYIMILHISFMIKYELFENNDEIVFLNYLPIKWFCAEKIISIPKIKKTATSTQAKVTMIPLTFSKNSSEF